MKIENAKITWLESGLPYSSEFQDIYYSRDDAIAESEHVFIKANRLPQRWHQDKDIDAFHIGELGFGSGLNFLQVIKLWQALDRPAARLHYIAFEKHPLKREELQKIHQHWPTLASQSAELLEQYTDHSEGCHRIPLANGITLDLYFGDAHEQLSHRMVDACPTIQCWFLDGFSPANNIELWEESLMHLIARCSDERTTLSTYSVAGKVRSALKNAGFEVSKIEGFGRKRHSLFAALRKDEMEAVPPPDSPWLTLPKPQFAEKAAVIIGAGLAGCSTAHSLAQRGWKVTVVESGPTPASSASGISQMALRCRLFNATSPEAEFFLHAYIFALRQFAQMSQHGDVNWNPCGVLQLSSAMNKRNPLKPEKLQQLYAEQVVKFLSETEASGEAGIALTENALFFPSGGAMEPTSLCKTYLAHSNINCLFNARVTELSRANEKWHINTDRVPPIAAEVVVIANSHSATQLSQCADLPLQSLRGQTTEIASNGASNKLKSIVSGSRTIFPAHSDRHLLSASYANSNDLQTLPADTHENIAGANANFVDTNVLNENVALERVSVRCNSPDRMPLVGMAPNIEEMRTSFGELSRNAKAKFTRTGEYYPGLYLNVAHGSNGLASCPLSAEFLASLITKENLPLSRDIADRLNPTRFLIQNLKKQR